MRLNITTDYAIRIVLYLAQKEEAAPSAELAAALYIPKNYIPNICRKLRDAGIIKATYGPDGGYDLAKPRKEISLLDVVKAVEEHFSLNRCLEEDGYCNRNMTETCPIHFIYKDIQKSIESTLSSYTFERLAEAQQALLSDRSK